MGSVLPGVGVVVTVKPHSSRIAQRVAGLDRLTTLSLFVAVYLGVYVPLALATAAFDYYPHAVDTIAVLVFISLATLLCGSLAWIRLPWYQPEESERRRENRGWLLLAAGALLVLLARAFYAVNELSGEPLGQSIPVMDAVFGSSFVFFVAGLFAFPWSTGQSSPRETFINAGVIILAGATALWPLLIGPVVTGEIAGEFSGWTVGTYMLGICILTFSVLWLVMRGVQHNLWGSALSLAGSVGAMVLLQVAYLGFLVTGGTDAVPLLLVNAATSLTFALFGLAAVLRLQATSEKHEDEDSYLTDDDRPIHRWQMMLPFPLIGILLMLRLGMELFDWRTEFQGVMVVGAIAIVILLMYRQVQLLEFNESLYDRVAGAAIRDGLTGLYNHRAMHELLQTQAAQVDRSGGSLAVLFLDIDRFKHYNDTFGHKQGDGLLTAVAEQLTTGARKSDIVGRYGGEEFMVIAPNITSEHACQLAERLRARIEDQQYVHNGTRSSVTVSAGVAMYPNDAGDPEAVVELADEAMYRAKAAGRNRTALYCPA